jgi:hypothetical protein
MARRALLTEEQWAWLLAPPTDECEIVRYWTSSREDLDLIFRKRSAHGRLGLALLSSYLRYPGRVLKESLRASVDVRAPFLPHFGEKSSSYLKRKSRFVSFLLTPR